jgi:hypothetical protein
MDPMIADLPFPEQPMSPAQAHGGVKLFQIHDRDYYMGIFETIVGPAVCLVTFNLQSQEKWRFVQLLNLSTVAPDMREPEGAETMFGKVLTAFNKWLAALFPPETPADDWEWAEVHERIMHIEYDADREIFVDGRL